MYGSVSLGDVAGGPAPEWTFNRVDALIASLASAVGQGRTRKAIRPLLRVVSQRITSGFGSGAQLIIASSPEDQQVRAKGPVRTEAHRSEPSHRALRGGYCFITRVDRARMVTFEGAATRLGLSGRLGKFLN